MRQRSLCVFAVLLALLILTGCRTITKESANLISTAAAVGQGDLNDWAEMTPKQRYTAHWKLTRAFYTLDFSVNDNSMPAHFVGNEGKNPPSGDSAWVGTVTP